MQTWWKLDYIRRHGYDMSQHFDVGDTIWLSIPTAGKLDPHWEGKWRIQSIKSPVNVKVTDRRIVRNVHVNHIQHQHQPDTAVTPPLNKETEVSSGWNPPQIKHTFQSYEDMTTEMDEDATLENQEQTRYPVRQRRPPDTYGIHICCSCGQAEFKEGHM